MRIKQYDELTFADDFMFCKVLEALKAFSRDPKIDRLISVD